jgi:hypothetical protein
VSRVRRRSEVAKLQGEIEALRPFLDLAREIREDVARIAADDAAVPEDIARLLDAIPWRERRDIALLAFRQLTPQEQWTVIERVFGDEEIRGFLADERAARLEILRRRAGHADVLRRARIENRLDTRAVEAGDLLTLGLFREADVRAAISRGHRSTTCARRLVLRGEGDAGLFHVIEDVFNPAGGYFVTADYDRDTWLSADRLPAHAAARLGSICESGDGRTFEPVLYIGARVDFEVKAVRREGLLHLGYVLIGDDDVFIDEGKL